MLHPSSHTEADSRSAKGRADLRAESGTPDRAGAAPRDQGEIDIACPLARTRRWLRSNRHIRFRAAPQGILQERLQHACAVVPTLGNALHRRPARPLLETAAERRSTCVGL